MCGFETNGRFATRFQLLVVADPSRMFDGPPQDMTDASDTTSCAGEDRSHRLSSDQSSLRNVPIVRSPPIASQDGAAGPAELIDTSSCARRRRRKPLTPQVKKLLLYGRIPGPAAEKGTSECPVEHHAREPDRYPHSRLQTSWVAAREAAAVTVAVSRYYD